MSVHKYTAGARTRNVVNLVQPGGTTGILVDYGSGDTQVLTAKIDEPTAATDGYKNFHSQQNLHLVIKNNGLVDTAGTPAAMTLNATVWVYNSSLGGSSSPLWTKLSLPMSRGDNNALEFYEVPTISVTAAGGVFRTILPIEGVERVAIQTTITGGNGTRGAGNYSIWLGANTI